MKTHKMHKLLGLLAVSVAFLLTLKFNQVYGATVQTGIRTLSETGEVVPTPGAVFLGWSKNPNGPVNYQVTDSFKLQTVSYKDANLNNHTTYKWVQAVTSNPKVTFTEDTVLYAQWDKRWLLTYDLQDGSMSTNVLSFFTNLSGTHTVLSEIPEKTGYVFDGWYTGKNGTGIKVLAGTALNPTGQTIQLGTLDSSDHSYIYQNRIVPMYKLSILYAYYRTPIITYNANGGEGTMAQTQTNSNGKATIAKNLFKKAGYHTKDDSSFTEFDTKYYDSYTKLKKCNEATGTAYRANSSNSQNGSSGILAWNTMPDGSGIWYASGSTYSFTIDTTLYAIWIKDPQYVTYKPNGGAGTDISAIIPPYENLSVIKNDFVKATYLKGHDFNPVREEWSATGISYKVGDYIPMGTSSFTLSAKWHTTEYHVVTTNDEYSAMTGLDKDYVINSNGTISLGAPSILPNVVITYNLNSNKCINAASPTWSDRTTNTKTTTLTKSFLYYTLGRTSAVRVSELNGTVEHMQSLVSKYLTTKYTVGNYPLVDVYKALGNTYFDTTKIIPFIPVFSESAQSTVLPNAVCSNYDFLGFSTNPNATVPDRGLEAGKTAEFTQNTELYAVWSPKKYVITFDCAPGKGLGATTFTVEYLYNDPIKETTSVPYFEGYYFDGFYTEPNGAGTLVYDALGNFVADSVTGTNKQSGKWLFTKNNKVGATPLTGITTLYAVWRYTVSYTSNEATNTETPAGQLETQTFTYGVDNSLRKNTYEKKHLVTFDFNISALNTFTKGQTESPMGSMKRGETLFFNSALGSNYEAVVTNGKNSLTDYVDRAFAYMVFSKPDKSFVIGGTKQQGTDTQWYGASYASNATVKNLPTANSWINHNLTAYAQWNDFKITLPEIRADGYEFLGWKLYTRKQSAGVYTEWATDNHLYAINEVYTIAGTVKNYVDATMQYKFIAQWKVKDYAIVFDAQGGRFYDNYLTENIETLPIYAFASYYNGFSYITKELHVDTTENTYNQEARRYEEKLAVYNRYKSDYESVSPLSETWTTGINSSPALHYDSPLIEKVAVPQKTGYIFQGFYTGPNGTGVALYDRWGHFTNNLSATDYREITGNMPLISKLNKVQTATGIKSLSDINTLYAYWIKDTDSLYLQYPDRTEANTFDTASESYSLGSYETDIDATMTVTANGYNPYTAVPSTEELKLDGSVSPFIVTYNVRTEREHSVNYTYTVTLNFIVQTEIANKQLAFTWHTEDVTITIPKTTAYFSLQNVKIYNINGYTMAGTDSAGDNASIGITNDCTTNDDMLSATVTRRGSYSNSADDLRYELAVDYENSASIRAIHYVNDTGHRAPYEDDIVASATSAGLQNFYFISNDNNSTQFGTYTLAVLMDSLAKNDAKLQAAPTRSDELVVNGEYILSSVLNEWDFGTTTAKSASYSKNINLSERTPNGSYAITLLPIYDADKDSTLTNLNADLNSKFITPVHK